MDLRSFFYGAFSVMLLILIMASFGLAHLGAGNKGSLAGNVISNSADPMADHHGGGSSDGGNVQVQSGFENIPQQCRPPAGQDIESWKEHLGHHAETKDCLKYF